MFLIFGSSILYMICSYKKIADNPMLLQMETTLIEKKGLIDLTASLI